MDGRKRFPPPSLIRRLLLEEIKEPILFHGMISEWEILSWDLLKWSDKLGDKIMPFRVGTKDITLLPQWERTCTTSNLTMKQFVELLGRKDTSEGCTSKWFYFDYKYMHEWFRDNPEILSGVEWKNFGFPEVKGDKSTIWIGSDGAHTPCHFDTYGVNLVAQIYGMKRWVLFPPDGSHLMFPTRVPYEESSIYSKLNFYSPNMSQVTNLEKAWIVTLKPGDVLFVPLNWWHYVENIGTAISVNTWLPLDSDSEKRVEESLVKLIVSQLTKEVHGAEALLNPNEDDVLNCTIEENVAVLETTLIQFSELQQFAKKPKDCRLAENSDRLMEENKLTDASPDSERSIQKSRSCSTYSCDDTKSYRDILSEFNSYIQIVPQLSKENLLSFLCANSSRFESSKMGDLPPLLPICSTIEKVINSVCHPEVISVIKTKLYHNFLEDKLN